jgi:hypothetical protein
MTVAPAQTSPLRTAAEAGDLEGMVQACAPDVVLHSPLTFKAKFRGRDEIRELFAAVLEVFEDIRYVEEHAFGDRWVVVVQARVAGRRLEEVQVVRVDDQGRISDLRLYIRGIAALTAVMATVGPRLARRRGRLPALVVAVAARPLAFITRVNDGPGVRLALGRRPED